MSDVTPAITKQTSRADERAGASWQAGVQVAVLAVLVWIIYRPAFGHMFATWKNDPNWSHGYLVPLFSLYFLVVHREEILKARPRTSVTGLLVMLASLVAFYVAMLKSFGYPRDITLIPCLLGLVLFLGGWSVLRVTWFPIAYLFFAIPIPGWLYFSLTLPLRKIASEVAGAALSLLPNVVTEVQGVVIDYISNGSTGSLNVEEACSGMRLMMAFCALGVAMAYLGTRPLWQRVIMVISCIPIAVACNTLRVFVTGTLHVYGYEEWARGSAHALIGLAMLPIALGLFALLGYILNNLLVEGTDDDDEEKEAPIAS